MDPPPLGNDRAALEMLLATSTPGASLLYLINLPTQVLLSRTGAALDTTGNILILAEYNVLIDNYRVNWAKLKNNTDYTFFVQSTGGINLRMIIQFNQTAG